VVGRLSWLEHRGVSDADRPLLQSWVRDLFAGQKADLGWEGRKGEDDDRRLRRAAVLRALALVARDPATVEEARQRYGKESALDPNLLDVVVPAMARGADRATFAQMRRRASEEIDPASKRRFLLALAMVESPDLVPEAVELSLRDDVKMQDFALYVAALLGNRAAREPAWELVRRRWDDVRKKGDSPMLLRRLVESLGALPERRHLDEVDRFLADHPLEGARQAIAQTLERMRMDVSLRERLVPEVSSFLRGRR
jgi:puromycin-sensitive aminopeptidase